MSEREKPKRRRSAINPDDEMYFLGVLLVFNVVYLFDRDQIVEEVVGSLGQRDTDNLMAVAKANHEPCEPKLRETVREMRRHQKWLASRRAS